MGIPFTVMISDKRIGGIRKVICDSELLASCCKTDDGANSRAVEMDFDEKFTSALDQSLTKQRCSNALTTIC